MALQIGGQLDRTFEDPLGLMMDCHRRIERFLSALLQVVSDAQGRELRPLEREALDVVLRYFAGMAPKHNADEEVSLFPRLVEAIGDADTATRERVAGILADHAEAGLAHGDVERLGRRWLDRGRLSAAEGAQLLATVQGLAALYREHIRVEDEVLYPLAAQRLTPEALAAVGEEMAARRGTQTCSQRKANGPRVL